MTADSPTNSFAIEEIRTLADAVGLHEWDTLVCHRPMQTRSWLIRWWSVFGEAAMNKELYVLALRDRNELIGVAPFYEHQIAGRRVLRFLGDSGDVCTDHTTCFAKEGYESSVAQAFADHLMQVPTWSRLDLRSAPQQDQVLQNLIRHLQNNGYLVQQTPTDSCWMLTVPPNWDEYLSMLSKSHRKRCRRLVRSYFDSNRVQVELANRENFERVWQTFLDLHSSRWGSDERSAGSFSDRRFLDFHESVARDALSADQLRLACLVCDKVPVAAEYQFIDHDTLYAYQSGMSQAASELQPGNLSLIATVRECIERGITKLDFLRGDEPYKAHWRASPVACGKIQIWPNNVTGRLEKSLYGAKDWAANLMRSDS